MDKTKVVELLISLLSENKTGAGVVSTGNGESDTFLEVGKIYAFRTVTMIYTGRLIGVNKQEYLVDECAWIPETERWADFVSTGAHKEAEPYTKPVTISRGAMLDATELPKTITKQK